MSVLEYMEKEKGISRSDMIDSITSAIQSAAKKGLNSGQDVRVEIDPRTGALKAWALFRVVDSVSDVSQEMHISKARQLDPNVALGDVIQQSLDPALLGRIAAQPARPLIMQRIRRFEKEHVYEQFHDRIGTIITGIVRRQERGDLSIDFGKAEGVLHRRDAIWSDDYGPGERICCLLLDIKSTPHGPELALTRSHVDFVKCLLSCEVSELNEGTVFIRNIVRDPGYRTKICVDTNDPKVDPVGACVGTRGSRIKNVLKELGQEKVDVIRYSDDISALVREAIRPAVPQNLTLDQANKVLHFDVDEKDFATVVGRKGQNVRLTSRLLGWQVDVNRAKRVELGFEEKRVKAMQVLSQLKSVTSQSAYILVTMGITSLDAFEGVAESDLVEAGIEAETAKAIIQEAKQLLEKVEE